MPTWPRSPRLAGAGVSFYHVSFRLAGEDRSCSETAWTMEGVWDHLGLGSGLGRESDGMMMRMCLRQALTGYATMIGIGPAQPQRVEADDGVVEGCKRRKWGISCEIRRPSFVLSFLSYIFFVSYIHLFFRMPRLIKPSNSKKSEAVAAPQPPAISVFFAEFLPPSPFLAPLTRVTPFFASPPSISFS